MVRHVIPLAALGLFLVPDWATATVRFRRCPPPVVPVLVPAPVAVCPPFLPVFDACGPVIYPGPVVLAAPRPASVAPLVPPNKPAPAEAPKLPPRVEADPPPPPGKSAAAPLESPTIPAPNVPAAPPPKTTPLVPVDPAAPKMPSLNPVGPGGGDGPPLLVDPPKGTRTSASSPLTAGGFEVRLVPAAGDPPASPSARRPVRFVNLSGLPVVLTVEGETAELPARHELTATVPPSFRWQLNGGEARAAEVPIAAPGAEVVIR